jgi:hypothetical protein
MAKKTAVARGFKIKRLAALEDLLDHFDDMQECTSIEFLRDQDGGWICITKDLVNGMVETGFGEDWMEAFNAEV